VSRLRLATALLLFSAAGCVTPYAVPEPLYRQVAHEVSLSQLRQGADQYKGTSVMFGGAVLGAKIIAEGTEIEVLQLPLDDGDRPSGPSELSEGRFLVIDPERRDPAVLQNRLITVVGEVFGTKVQKLDEVDYSYPLLSARFIHVWRGPGRYAPEAAYPYYYPSYSPYYYYPYGPYYPYYYTDPFFWSGSFHYYYYDYDGYGGSSHRHSERRFEGPTGGGAPLPSGSAPAPSPPGYGGGGGGGGGRHFK
jgi:outer membrane lipoprotein